MDDLLDLAKVHCVMYASPHHMTFTIGGLKALVAELSQPVAEPSFWVVEHMGQPVSSRYFNRQFAEAELKRRNAAGPHNSEHRQIAAYAKATA